MSWKAIWAVIIFLLCVAWFLPISFCFCIFFYYGFADVSCKMLNAIVISPCCKNPFDSNKSWMVKATNFFYLPQNRGDIVYFLPLLLLVMVKLVLGTVLLPSVMTVQPGMVMAIFTILSMLSLSSRTKGLVVSMYRCFSSVCVRERQLLSVFFLNCNVWQCWRFYLVLKYRYVLIHRIFSFLGQMTANNIFKIRKFTLKL